MELCKTRNRCCTDFLLKPVVFSIRIVYAWHLAEAYSCTLAFGETKQNCFSQDQRHYLIEGHLQKKAWFTLGENAGEMGHA